MAVAAALAPLIASAAGAGINAADQAIRDANKPNYANELAKLGFDPKTYGQMGGGNPQISGNNLALDQVGLANQVANMGAPDFSKGEQQGFQQQQFLANQLHDATLGMGPSVAQQQLQRGLQQNLGQQMAIAAGQRGPAGVAMGGYNAAQGAAAANQATNQQAAELRAQEMMQARQQLGGLSAQMREQGQGMGFGMADLGLRKLGAQGQFGMNAGQLSQMDLQGKQRYMSDFLNWMSGMTGNDVQKQKLSMDQQKQYTQAVGNAIGGATSKGGSAPQGGGGGGGGGG